jgi:hypothetical protein
MIRPVSRCTSVTISSQRSMHVFDVVRVSISEPSHGTDESNLMLRAA